MNDLQKLVRERRGKRTLQQMSDLSGLSKAYWWMVEQGIRPRGPDGGLSKESIMKLARGCKVSPLTICRAWLAKGEGE